MSSNSDDETMHGVEISVTLGVEELPDDESAKPCDFCSTVEHETHIMERGFVEAEYRLTNTYGVTFGHTCELCIAGATSQ